MSNSNLHDDLVAALRLVTQRLKEADTMLPYSLSADITIAEAALNAASSQPQEIKSLIELCQNQVKAVKNNQTMTEWENPETPKRILSALFGAASARPSFKTAEDLIKWLDTLYETEGDAITNRKWSVAQAAIATLAAPSAPESREAGRARNWTEDAQYENGNYMNQCSACGNRFFGYKRRVICKVCAPSFQARVQPWMMECFGLVISGDTRERNHRFLEEALELVQACGCTIQEAYTLVHYVFNRPVGEVPQEIGGVMVTLAALCLAQKQDMHLCGDIELMRIMQPEIMNKIREKQKAKRDIHSPLP